MRLSQTGIWTSTSLEPALIRLSAAHEMQEFWEATKSLLHLALPIHFCCLCFRPFIVMPATVFRERDPFADTAEFQRFRELCPFSAYIEHHPEVRVIRLSDIIGMPRLMKTEFFRSFMQPYGDRFQVYLAIWESSVFQGLIGLHRTAQQRDFTDTEVHLLEQLYPHFQNAGKRVLISHREKARRMSLEVLLSRLPIATIILDWDFQVTYRNRAAEELGILWNLGPQAARSLKPSQHFEVPTDIVAACRRLKETWDYSSNLPTPLGTDNRLMIEHQRLAGLRASINVLQMDAAPLSLPMFLVTLEHRGGPVDEENEDGIGNQLALWSQLTRCEQRVAWLAAQGHRTAEIAQLLNKSGMTVKKQLQSVYHKLDVPSRGRLIALVQSANHAESERQQAKKGNRANRIFEVNGRSTSRDHSPWAAEYHWS